MGHKMAIKSNNGGTFFELLVNYNDITIFLLSVWQ